MKKTLLLLTILFVSSWASAQNGLEGIVVEKYYVSNANDTNANSVGGVLPVGSVTYRIYVDMLQGYKFQAAYGVPGHDLRIQTSTLFFNNEDRGSTSPTFSRTLAAKNTVMLDSWLSVGAACNNYYGILKSMDNGVMNVVNNFSPQVLQNNDPLAGIPLTTQDGFIAGTPEPVTTVGISNEITVFDNQNDGTNGPLFFTNNGSWASLNGSVGPDTVDNKVLIAQITTDGIFSFELNIQNYVATNPVGAEISIPSLMYSSAVGLHAPDFKSMQVIVYPNPANDLIKLKVIGQSTHNGSYKLLNLSGQTLDEKVIGNMDSSSEEMIDLSKLTTGLYFLQFTSDEGTYTQKIIKR
jgi:hypothetical protein